MHTITILVSALLISTGSELEIAGDFVEAGSAYYEETNISGQARILSRYLEEALYSGRTIHAFDLILQMEGIPIESSLLDFWYARLSWNCGLHEFACEALDSVRGSQWLETRAQGLAFQFRGDALSAVEKFSLSIRYAESSRQRFYSALDLSFALLQTDNLQDAEEIAIFLAANFPGEGLPLISLALCYQQQNRYGEAMSVLQSLYSDEKYSAISRLFAANLLEDLE